MKIHSINAVLGTIIILMLLSACTNRSVKTEETSLTIGNDQYILGSEDVIEVSVWKEPELSKVIMIRPDGKISLPLIGDIQAAGLSAEKLTENIVSALEDFVDSPTVAVIVEQINSLKIFIQGEIAKPGVFFLRSNTTLLQAISLAGGFSEWAKKDEIAILRKAGDKLIRIPINYEKILSGEDLSQNILLQRGDTIIVP